MSDDPPKKPWFTREEALAVTPEEVSDFMGKTVKTEKCPYCETDSWWIFSPAPERHAYSAIQLQEGPQTIGGQHIPVVVLSCATCGFVRMHSMLPIVDWKKRGRGSGNVSYFRTPGGPNSRMTMAFIAPRRSSQAPSAQAWNRDCRGFRLFRNG